MNGIVLSTGYLAINLSAKRKLEFNELMINFYDLGDEAAINAFRDRVLILGMLR